MSLAIRSRLALWFAAILGLLLAVFAATLYLVHSRSRLRQFDAELARAGALLQGLVVEELDEGSELGQASSDALEDVSVPGRSLAVFDAGGTLLAGEWRGLPAGEPSTLGARSEALATVAVRGGRFRVYRARHRHRETTYEVGVAESLAHLEAELGAFRRTVLGGALLILALAVGGGWWIARAALRPLGTMAADARYITERTPGVRLRSPHAGDELGQLARTFNELLARLETALAQQRRFMADTSHELRTPVSIARTAIDVTLARQQRPESEYRDALLVLREQLKRLTRIVEDLFMLARADASGLPLERRPLYLDELVAASVNERGVLAGPKGVSLDWSGTPELEAWGDEALLRQMIGNLLDNAIRHTPAGGRVQVQLETRPDALAVAVSDTGPGIAQADRERIFDRFVRLESPARSGEGAGLGLPIARAIAEAHGGTLALTRSDAGGSTFLATLPRQPPTP